MALGANQGLDQAAPAAAGDVVTVNPAVTHQTMRGWEVTAQADHYRSDYAAFQNAALDKVVEAGINRVRLEVRSGSENTVDSFGAWQAAGYPSSGTAYQEWRARRYETINDNGDSNTAAAGRFHWSELDSTVDRIVNPLRTRMAAKGESLYVNLTYVAFYGAVTSGASNVHQNPAEYAEFMLEVFKHLQQKYGWTPNAVNLVLEPDNTNNWNGTLIGQTIVAVGSRLAAAGFTPQLIGPSTTNMTSAPLWFDQMMAVPNVATYLKELSYHRYHGVSTATLQSIAAKAQAAGIGSSMLEWWDPANNFAVLHEDLTTGRNSAWQQSIIVELTDPGGLGITYINPSAPTVAVFTSRTKFTQQYYKHVRQGAVRLDAASTTGRLAPLAFRNASGLHTVVVKATAGGTFAVNGLPAGTYGVYYTASTTGSAANPDLHAVSLPDQTIGAGQSITTDIPAYGVLTVFGKTAGSAAPVAANDGYATAFNTPLTIAAPGVLANDNANGSGTMTAVQPSAASSGTVTVNSNGSFTYTPASGFSGAATFTYRASNSGGLSNVATVTVTVAAAPNAPSATADSYATAFNTPLTIAAPGVLANDNANGSGTMTAVQPSAASSGTVTVNSNGGFTYTPAAGFSGTATFTYRASNSGGLSNVATVSVAVSIPLAPTAAGDAYATPLNTPLTVAAPGVLGNDNANGGGTLTAVLVSAASSGAVTLNANGSFTYAPLTGFNGVATFTYRASNAGGPSNIATVTITVAAPILPFAVNDAYSTPHNTPLYIGKPGVLSNDSANGGGVITAVQFSAASAGVATYGDNGRFSFTPPTGFSGTATFTYRASTANGVSDAATVTITVAPPNAPTANDNVYTTPFNTTLTVPAAGVLANDNTNGGGVLTAVNQSPASSGTAVLNGNGSFTYTPATGFTGAATFTYRASSSGGLSNVATVTITVAGSSPPSANDDSYNTPFNTTLTIGAPGVLANDVNNAGIAMTAVQPSTPSSGAVTLNADGSFTYAPPNGFTGTATFTYRASTGGMVSDGATVTITVAAAGVPAALDDDYATVYVTPLTVAAPGVLGNDNSQGGGTMSAAIVSTTSSGTLSLAANGGFSYTPNDGFTGTDTFTYRATNAMGAGTTATARIVVARSGETLPATDLRVVAISGNQVTLAWAPPTAGPQPTGFQIEGGLAPGESLGAIPVGAVPSVTLTWPNGSFYVRVRTVANGVVGAPSNEAVVHVGVPMPPSPPSGLLGVAAGDSLTLAWKNTYIGGAPTGVTLQVSGPVSGAAPLGLTDTFSFAGVPPGTYTFTVIATNAGGTSTASNPVTLNFPTSCSQAPQTVSNFVAYNEGGTLVATWDPPASGAAPTTYVVNVTGTHAGSFPTPQKKVRGPVPPGTYTLSVVPTNPCGTGGVSPQQTVVVP